MYQMQVCGIDINNKRSLEYKSFVKDQEYLDNRPCLWYDRRKQSRRSLIMMYPYMTLSDETEIVHSQIVEKNGVDTILVHFERPTDDGFDSKTLGVRYH